MSNSEVNMRLDTNWDLKRVKKAKHIFILVQGKNDGVFAKIDKKEAIFILEHNEEEFEVRESEKHMDGKTWTEAFIVPATT